ncbi:bifunctional methylenetetrahydrofolate dehydrogenase/methenyltetrahydrofolate cyclohydrolase FolD [Coxiella endosymbiont of Amblyomma americanum]|uniref:bifunctional methylenetetrahydrofolate dehydrogenase/methenyltetrahydrofolate cyclohydrolase FolD n=1 Tax=Coxiella endosymbiont of Amblyomma americanum TaxID=325775 RepID=UPI00057EFD61|nr:bifunctional methylenetetrahydrofolate dehydrogenase/methenyltetrahydrofolate cyclohydrolase FolD [Coxiella endosymbiont of Amblyomma americanum]AJC50465.1 methenyltetrahydrofolate cyclohydrolase [Coxiella endosymbiont of Amblyomma americanum]AUJ58806.1 bifunctional 5,10-methylene-tetrahydrofolate dehydrogenase/5,10-methylene-tetrahydrofolate cyclohydrolase [Coxiella-like endosymbiont of Amblyomma americanum]
MIARILDGRACAKKVRMRVKKAVSALQAQGMRVPGLSMILVGDNPASSIYVRQKELACRSVGIRSTVYRMNDTVLETELATKINQCNIDPSIHGILLQLPLPIHINAFRLLEQINPSKDVDGFHPYNLGCLVQRHSTLRPCTSAGIITLLRETNQDLSGKHAVIIGASSIVGRPMALELLLTKCTVTICHRFTQNLDKHVNTADLLIAAIGKPGIIQSKWIKPGAIVIDVGFNRLDQHTITGDIDFKTAKEKVSWITPVPGGVGPMTVATLLENTLKAANNSTESK